MSQQASNPQELNFLQQKAMEWAKKVVELHNTDFPPALMPKKNALMASAQKIKSALELFFRGAPWLADLNKIAPQGVSAQLGVVFVPLAVIGVAAATAYIAKWSYDFANLMLYRKDRDAYIATGMNPQQASNLAQQNYNAKNSLTNFLPDLNLKKYAVPALVIAGAYFLLRKRA